MLDLNRIDEIGSVNRNYVDLMNKITTREQEIEKSNQELESFSYSVSHDLRAPLRHITGYIDLLERNLLSLTDDTQRYFDIVKSESMEMDRLITSLLEYSRLGRKELVLNVFDHTSIVHQIVNEYSLIKTGIDVQWTIQDLGEGIGDKTLITTVWANLIDNAFKYSSTYPSPEIIIGKMQTVSSDIYYVKDNGTGFDMKYYDSLFGVFQRLHTEDDYKGVGIGLANVKRIIELHKGKIWAESEEGHGAIFYFSIGDLTDD